MGDLCDFVCFGSDCFVFLFLWVVSVCIGSEETEYLL